jgi:hypothetical protein
MIELERGCAHLIFPYGVLYGCVAVLSVDAKFWPRQMKNNGHVADIGVCDGNVKK